MLESHLWCSLASGLVRYSLCSFVNSRIITHSNVICSLLLCFMFLQVSKSLMAKYLWNVWLLSVRFLVACSLFSSIFWLLWSRWSSEFLRFSCNILVFLIGLFSGTLVSLCLFVKTFRSPFLLVWISNVSLFIWGDCLRSLKLILLIFQKGY